MKQYDVFKSEGGYRYAGQVCNGGNPVMSSSPWFETEKEAKMAVYKKQKEITDWEREFWHEEAIANFEKKTEQEANSIE